MIIIKTRFNNDMVLSLQKNLFRTIKRLFLFLSIILILCGSIVIYLATQVSNSPESLEEGIFMIFYGVLLYPALSLIIYLTQRYLNKSMSILGDDNLMDFEFYEHEVIVRNIKGSTYEGYTKASYSIFFKVQEYKDSFLMFISRNQSFVVPKKDFVEGSIEDLIHIFESNLSKKQFIRLKTKS